MENLYGLADVPNLAAAGSYSWTLTMTTAKRDTHEGEGMSTRPALVVLVEVHIEASPDGDRSRHECMLPVPVGNRSNSGCWPKARDLEADGSLSQVLERGRADDTPVGDAAALRTWGNGR